MAATRAEFLWAHGLLPSQFRQSDLASMHFQHRTPPKPDGISASRLAVGAIRLFKKWLSEHLGADAADGLVQMSPDVLDLQLAEFLATVRKQDGSDYRPNSLRSLRQGIDFYLKDHGYPYSVISSPEFQHTHIAYKTRMQILNSKASDGSVIDALRSNRPTVENSDAVHAHLHVEDRLHNSMTD